MITRSGQLATIELSEGARLIVFGDIHGDLGTLDRGMALRRPKDVLLFLGDYADRGPQGVEVIERISALIDRLPHNVVALKGNHESYSPDGEPRFRPCTLIDEAAAKRGSWEAWFPGFRSFVSKLHLAAIVPGRALFVHAGVDDTIDAHDRLEAPDPALEETLIWSDPGWSDGLAPSPRGAGALFGPDVSRRVCDALEVPRIVRSHEPRKAFEGPYLEHEDRIMTTSSTTVYGGRGFVLLFDPEPEMVPL